MLHSWANFILFIIIFIITYTNPENAKIRPEDETTDYQRNCVNGTEKPLFFSTKENTVIKIERLKEHLRRQAVAATKNDQYVLKAVTIKIEKLTNGKYIETNLIRTKAFESLHLKPFSLQTTNYQLTVSENQFDPTTKTTKIIANIGCNFNIAPVPPIAIISGGYLRTVPEGSKITVDGRKSTHKNVEEVEVTFYWTCTQTTNPATICAQNPISTSNILEIPEKFATFGEVFRVTLQVGIFIETVLTHKTEQTIEVLGKNLLPLQISCLKNCEPVVEESSVNQITYFKLDNGDTFEDVQPDEFEWSIKAQPPTAPLVIDYAKDTQFGHTGYKFILNKNVLKPGKYEVKLILNSVKSGRKGDARMKISVIASPMVDSCKINPPSGETFITEFTLECVQNQADTKNHLYELYATPVSADGDLIMASHYEDLSHDKFLLPVSVSGKKMLVHVIADGGSYTSLQVEAIVKGTNDTNNEDILKLWNTVYMMNTSQNSIQSMLFNTDENENKKALQKLQVLVDALHGAKTEDADKEKFFEDIKYYVTKDLLKTPIHDVNNLLQMGHSVVQLMNKNPKQKSDPILQSFMTTLCKKMSDKALEMVNHTKYPTLMEDKTKQLAHVLTNCVETNINPDEDILEPISYPNITTLAPMETAFTEDYEYYVDFNDSHHKSIEVLQEVTLNTIETTSTAAKLVALSMVGGELVVEIKARTASSVVVKNEGRDIPGSKMKSHGVSLVPSEDFRNATHVKHMFDVFMTIWKRDITWWNEGQVVLATNLANIEFWHSTCRDRMLHFDEPALVSFNIIKNESIKETIMKYEMKVPKEFHDTQLNPFIRVHRVTLPKFNTFRVIFHNLTLEDEFDVVLTEFRYPTIDDFSKSKTVKLGNKPFFRLSNDNNYPIWAYLGILPNQEAMLKSQKTDFTYYVSFSIATCVHWKIDNSTWIPACKPGASWNRDVITCKCTSFGVLAGYLQEVPAPIEKKIPPDPPFTLFLQSTRIILITTTIVFVLYCLVLLTVSFKKKEYIFYLADNMTTCRYAYLVVVKTGGHHAGTTSNIGIKIHGEKNSSEPHILNNPDPDFRLLQRYSEDFFALTTQNHLGNVRKVELWSDYSGPSPLWNCEEVLLYDLQTQEDWYFYANKRLTVIHGSTHVFLEPGEKPKGVSVLGRLRSCDGTHTWYCSTDDGHFSLMKRLTIILSRVLMTEVIALVMIVPPTFSLKSNFDLYEYYFDWYYVFVAFISSLSTCMVHLVLTYVFRSSKIQFSQEETNRKVWPYKYTVICWVFLIALIVTSMSLLIMCGFWVPYFSSWVWLSVTMLAIFMDIVIWENIFVIIWRDSTAYSKTIAKVMKKYEGMLRTIEEQRLNLHEKFGGTALRPFMQSVLKPLKENVILEKGLVAVLRIRITHELRDFLIFGFFIFTVYMWIIFQRKDLSVIMRREMTSMLNGSHHRTLTFDKVKSIPNFYDFVEHTFIPTILPTLWYANRSISGAGLMIDLSNQFLGIVRLRQHRVTTDSCKVEKLMRFLNCTCWPEYSSSLTETKSFGFGWASFTEWFHKDRLKAIWGYSPSHVTKTSGSSGEMSSYSGDGYVAYLGRNLLNSKVNFYKLRDKVWVDSKTRTVFIEFLTYNTNVNIFCSVRLLMEQSATGYINKQIEVIPVTVLSNTETEFEKFRSVAYFLMIIFALILLGKQIYGVFTNIRTFYKNAWFMFDFMIIFLTLFSVYLGLIRKLMIKAYIDAVEDSKQNEFVDYFAVYDIHNMFSVCNAFLVCTATIRLWRFLRFGLIFRILERTLWLSSKPLLATFFSFTVILLAFGCSGIILFGNHFRELHSILDITRTLITLTLKPDQFDISRFIMGKISYGYFSVYLILINILLFLYVTIIIMAYMKAKLQFSDVSETYNIKHYITEQSKLLPKRMKTLFKRLRGGHQEDRPNIIPKADEFRYANCISTPSNTMITMELVTKCILRNSNKPKIRTKLSDEDSELMANVCRHLVFKDHLKMDAELFFKGHFAGEKMSLIDEKRIQSAAHVAETILQKNTVSNKKPITSKDDLEKCTKIIKDTQKIINKCDLGLKNILHRLDNINLH